MWSHFLGLHLPPVFVSIPETWHKAPRPNTSPYLTTLSWQCDLFPVWSQKCAYHEKLSLSLLCYLALLSGWLLPFVLWCHMFAFHCCPKPDSSVYLVKNTHASRLHLGNTWMLQSLTGEHRKAWQLQNLRESWESLRHFVTAKLHFLDI